MDTGSESGMTGRAPHPKKMVDTENHIPLIVAFVIGSKRVKTTRYGI